MGKDGVRMLLERLANSPLVRRNLPNTSAIMNQYFTYRRGQNESISSYLVREALYFEEFVESLSIMKDEQDGRPRPLLPDFSDEESDDDEDGGTSESKPKKGYTRVPTEDPDPTPAAAGTSPLGGSRSVPAASPKSRASTMGATPPQLNEFDSFILRQLRGWRLLQGACLNAEEWRAVMASTSNRLDYANVSTALTILFDEQAVSRHHHHGGGSHQGGPAIFAMNYEDEWDAWSSWDPSYYGYYTGWDEDYDAYYEEDFEDIPEEHETKTEDDAASSKPEKDAMVQQTWSQAHRSTQMARRDRSFGKGSPGKSADGCFICGHPGHHARQCPDRYGPGKGKGKSMNYAWADDDDWSYAAAAFSKGKNKGKHHGKQANYMDEMMYFFKGKNPGKGKGKIKSKNQNTVNAYAMDYASLHGLEIETDSNMNLNASEKGSVADVSMKQVPLSGGMGMLDSGATCSAGPEGSINRLIAAVLERDHQAAVVVDAQKRPKFRYGSGKWGKALYQATISSSLSPNVFQAFALPDPEESKEPWFEHHTMLVPVLIGMDFITSNGMIIDFSDGHCVCAAQQQPRPFQLPRNNKGHFMVDLVHFLTQGDLCDHGHPQIQVLVEEGTLGPNFSNLSSPWADHAAHAVMFTHQFEAEVYQVSVRSHHEQLFASLCERRFRLNQQTGLMGSLLSAPNSTSTSSPTTHGDQEGKGSEGAGSPEGSANGSQRPSKQGDTMALHGDPSSSKAQIQPVGSMDDVHSVRPSSVLHSHKGITRSQLSEPQSWSGEESPGPTSRDHAKRNASRGKPGPGDDREGHGRGALDDSHGGVQEAVGEGDFQGGEGQGEDDCGEKCSQEWSREFRRQRLSTTASISKDGISINKLGGGKPSPRGSVVPPHGGREESVGGESQGAQSPSSGCGNTPDGCKRAGVRLQATMMELPPEEGLCRPLPLRLGNHMLNLMNHIQSDLHSKMSEMVYDSKPLIWEMFCSPNSNLTAACHNQGLEAIRINLANHFDLYRDDTWSQVYTLYDNQRPKAIWVSPRCTFFCDFVNLNYWDRPEVFQKYLRRERKMLRKLVRFLQYAASQGSHFYWEWPKRCRGWREPIVTNFIEEIKKEIEVWWCRIDGCRFGMKSSSGNFLLKSWSVLTSDVDFYGTFRLRCCLKNHEHEPIQGKETEMSSYYPIGLCTSIARHWQQRLLPRRWLKMLWTAPVTATDPFKQLMAVSDADDEFSETDPGADLPDRLQHDDRAQHSELVPHSDGARQPVPQERSRGDLLRWDDGQLVSTKDQETWKIKLLKFHRAAGHPSSRNLARMLHDAQVEKWKIKMALSLKCPACEELKPGGSSSKQIPPSSMRPLPEAWDHLGIDVSEWTVPGKDLKLKFVLFMDMATRYKVTENLFSFPHGERRSENAEQLIQAITLRWLMDKPRPKVVIPDNAKSMSSQKFVDFLSEICIEMVPPPDRESWAHGMVERAIEHVKETASLIQQAQPDHDPVLTLALATAAINSTEYTQGYTSMQWAFGKQAELGDEEFRQQLSVPLHRRQNHFARLMNQRLAAEDSARKAKARTTMQKLKNSSVRQPVRSYNMAEPVMIWRKFLPHTLYKGRKGGKKLVIRPRWVGPGRVVLHELIPGQDESDRRQIVWVVLGNILYRVSVHSVRPLTDRERQLFEAQGDESHRWRELTDMIPNRNYVDVTNEEPTEEEVEGPHLPLQPNYETRIPAVERRRIAGKSPVDFLGNPVRPEQPEDDIYSPSVVPSPPEDNSGVNVYEDEPAEKRLRFDEPIVVDDDPGALLPEGALPASTALPSSISTSSPTPPQADALPAGDLPRSEVPQPDSSPTEPEAKRPRLDSGDEADDLALDLCQAIQETDYGYLMNVELDFSSKHQKKAFIQNPQAFLVKKLSSSEVCYRKLTPEDKQPFENAKDSEASSFIKTEAVRRCLSHEEQMEAKKSDRVLRARWVLVWKPTAQEDMEKAQTDAAQNSKTCYKQDGSAKAKARIVVLFEHPDLLQSTFKASAPVQSMLMRNLSLLMVAQRNWILEGLDMSTAFLQTGKFEMEQQKLWTHGVPELKRALGAEEHEVLRLLRNIYGNATAPRGLWKDVDRTFTNLGAKRIVGDASFWVWTEPNPDARNEGDAHHTIGFVGGHVDDFNRAGDMKNEKWLRIRDAIDKAYKWGSMKSQSFRHTGIDLEVCEKGDERWVQLNQDYYIEGISDLAIPLERLRQDPQLTLTPSEMAACRASLGALQWVATQTQLQICARVNLLLTELTVYKTVGVAKEIGDLVKEVRKDPVTLKLWRLPEVHHWQDATIVTLADQAHCNRPNGGSTGGLITFIGGPQIFDGQSGRMSVVSWRTWKLRRHFNEWWRDSMHAGGRGRQLPHAVSLGPIEWLPMQSGSSWRCQQDGQLCQGHHWNR